MPSINIIELKDIGDARGSLISLEQNKNIPFEIKRIYYIFGNSLGASRGFHAHLNLEQVAICLRGHVTFLIDDGVNKESITLDSPKIGLHISGLKWREMHDFSEDCMLIVVASELYDETDYIRDYSEFLSKIK